MSPDEPLDLFSSAPEEPEAEPEPELAPEPDPAPSASPTRPDPPEPQVWSVFEINAAVRTLLEDTLPPVWIRGEVANWTRARSGHCYFTLKDDRAQVRCVMWKGQAASLPVDPEEGMKVRIFGILTLYEARGEYQVGVRQLQGEGEDGLWKLAFEKLRLKLREEGLLDPARKRPIPRFPATVGVVTSPTGAALRDILSVIRRRAPWTRVLVRGARVQGAGASAEVARAMEALLSIGEIDVLIVGRGGGSIEDLWAFNEEPVARAIADSRVPVISAVGHETDVTISDLVADLRAPTPSAAAEAAVQDGTALQDLLRRVRPRLARGLRSQIDRRRSTVRDSGTALSRRMQAILQPRRAVLDSRRERLVPAVRRVLEPLDAGVLRRRERLQRGITDLVSDRRGTLLRAAGQIEALSPLSTMRRGYAIPLDGDGAVLRAAADFVVDHDFRLRVVDGTIHCRIEDVAVIEPPEIRTGDS